MTRLNYADVLTFKIPVSYPLNQAETRTGIVPGPTPHRINTDRYPNTPRPPPIDKRLIIIPVVILTGLRIILGVNLFIASVATGLAAPHTAGTPAKRAPLPETPDISANFFHSFPFFFSPAGTVPPGQERIAGLVPDRACFFWEGGGGKGNSSPSISRFQLNWEKSFIWRIAPLFRVLRTETVPE